MKVAILLLLSLLYLSQAELSYDRTLLVDVYQNNLLFRTNDPTNSTDFQVDQLVQFFKMRCQEAQIKFPDQFQLVTVTLLDPTTYPEQFRKENTFYTHNPSAGQLVSYPIKIEPYDNPQLMTPEVRENRARSYQDWSYNQLQTLSKFLRDKLTQQTSIPQVIFFHCISGVNIVITAFGSYQLHTYNQNLKQVFDWNQQHQLPAATNAWNIALDWYCYNLQYTQSRSSIANAIDYKCDT